MNWVNIRMIHKTFMHVLITLVCTDKKLKSIKHNIPLDLSVHEEQENLCFVFVEQKLHEV